MSSLPPSLACETPREAGVFLAASRAGVEHAFTCVAKTKLAALQHASDGAIAKPVAGLLLRLIAVTATDDARSSAAHDAICDAGVAHAQARTGLPDYAIETMANEYAILRESMWRAWQHESRGITEGLLWLQSQVDVAASAALKAFDAMRQTIQLAQEDMGLSGPLIGGLGDPFWKYDAEADVLMWGEELVSAWGYPASARRGPLGWWSERIHDDDRQRILDEMHTHATTQTVVGCYYYRWQHADGHFVHVADRIYRIIDTQGIARVWVGMMVATEWPLLTRDAQKTKFTSRPRPQADAVKPLPSSLTLIDTQRRFVYANQALLDYWRLSLDAIRGRSLEEVIGHERYLLFPHEAPRAFGGSFVSFEVPFRAQNGEARWHLFNYLPYRDTDDVVQGVVCHVTDLHLFVAEGDDNHDRHRRFSRQYQALLAELEQYLAVPESSAQALDASEQRIADLEAQSLARERFVTMLTHDLRNPLAAARITAERLLRKSQQTASDSTTKRPLPEQRLIVHLDRADRMVTDLLDANRLQSGAQLVVERAAMNLGRVIEEVVRDFSLASDRIAVELPPAAVEGLWDAKAIRRILENLLSNAVKYGDGQTPITVSLTADTHLATLCVHNWGEPLPRQGRDVLFHPFERTAKATQSGQPGWGIGLALVQALAQAHGGTVRITSAQRQGTSFRVSLPIAPPSDG